MRLYLQGCGPLSCVDVHGAGSLADLQAAVQVGTRGTWQSGRASVLGPGNGRSQGIILHEPYHTTDLSWIIHLVGGWPGLAPVGRGYPLGPDCGNRPPPARLKACRAALCSYGQQQRHMPRYE